MPLIIALDVEGTLISNAISQIARPGLYDFLESCNSIAERVVVFTTIKEDRFRNIAQLLVSENSAPAWFGSVEYIQWEGHTKDLSWIHGASIADCVLVDDCEAYIHAGQLDRWLEVKQFVYPYSSEDVELQSVLSELKLRFDEEGDR